MSRVVIDPKTGRMHTVDDVARVADLERMRRETRARIDGTEQFHVDPFATPAPAPAAPKTTCFCAYLGETCEVCEPGRGDA